MQKTKNSYKKSGVNISLANSFVNHIANLSKKHVKKGKKSNKFNNIGGFGSVFDISNHKINDPLIVSCTDGVGTKLALANQFKKFDTIGIDLVAMCVNDLIVQGAKPLFFLDYIAVGKLDLKKTKNILKGIFRGCEMSNCKLIGGETAEMPGVYSKNKFDLAGFSVGIVSKKKILDKKNVKKNDVILAVPSNGIHSNGFSLIRKIISKTKIDISRNNFLKKNRIKNFTLIDKINFFEKKSIKILKKYKIDILCLAGFMRILSVNFINKFKKPILNIHPSLLPKLKGLNTHERAIKSGHKFSGCTVHLVNARLDSGKKLGQVKVEITKNDNAKSLKKKILRQEHILYPNSLNKFIN